MQIPHIDFVTARRLLWQLLKLSSRSVTPVLKFRSTDHGLTLHVEHDDVCFQQRLSSNRLPLDFNLSFELLDQLRQADGPVELTISGTRLVVDWFELGVVPRQLCYDVESAPPPDDADLVPPELIWQPMSARLQQALSEAITVTDSCASRYALHCLQLCRSRDTVAATDGRQLYLATAVGLPSFTPANTGEPLPDELLIPGSRLFSIPEFKRARHLHVAISPEWFAVRWGDTTVWLRLTKQGRFPNVQLVIPRQESAITRLSIEARDQLFLAKTLRALPGHPAPVTVDLNGHVAIRAVGPDSERPTELHLSRSVKSGSDICWLTHREYLQRAATWGLGELRMTAANAPVVAQDAWRTLVWMPLPPAQAPALNETPQRIDSQATEPRRRQAAATS